MNDTIKDIARQAGFCFWDDEEWRPPGAVIDWSSNYDEEFKAYTNLLIKHICNKAFDWGHGYFAIDTMSELGISEVVEVQEGEDGEMYIEIPRHMLEAIKVKEGDSVTWNDNGDGSYTLTKA